MRASGVSAEGRLAFDLGCVTYARRFRAYVEETKMVDAPQPSKHRRAQVPAPAHSEEEILAVLGLAPEERERAAGFMAPTLSDADWEALPWDEDDAE